MSTRIPSDEEAYEAAERHGIIEPGEYVGARKLAGIKRFLVAQTDVAEAESAVEQQAADVSAVAVEMRSLYSDLTCDDGLSDLAAAHVLAALAPTIWRITSTRKKAATS